MSSRVRQKGADKWITEFSSNTCHHLPSPTVTYHHLPSPACTCRTLSCSDLILALTFSHTWPQLSSAICRFCWVFTLISMSCIQTMPVQCNLNLVCTEMQRKKSALIQPQKECNTNTWLQRSAKTRGHWWVIGRNGPKTKTRTDAPYLALIGQKLWL